MTGWRPSLRLARRSLWRNKGASLLVLLLIALPVSIGSLVSITARTGVVTADESWVSENGLADLQVVPRSCGDCGADQSPQSGQVLERNTRTALNALPPGSQLVKSENLHAGIEVSKGERSVEIGTAKAFDGHDPHTAGMAVLQGGRWPQAADEIALSPGDLDALQADVGNTVSVIATEYPADAEYAPADGAEAADEAPAATPEHVSSARIVGIVDEPTMFEPSLYVEGTNGPVGDATPNQGQYRRAIGVTLPPGASVGDARRAVDATAAAEMWINPVLEPSLASNRFVDMIMSVERWIPTGITGFAACLGLLVVGLLARTAFAVTARRSRHDIGLAMIAGARPRQVRLITTAQGAILGLTGAMVGVGGGFVAFFALRGRLADATQARLDGRVEFGQSLWVVVVACVITAVLAAASVAVKEPASPVVAVAASGRPTRERKWVGVVGVSLLLLGVGGLIAFITVLNSPYGPGMFGRRELLLSYGSGGGGVNLSPWLCAATAVLGAMMLMPRFLLLLGRIVERLPANPRLAVRSTVRSRHRTGPVLAAVLTITSLGVAGLVTLAGSVHAERAQYLPSTPQGVVAIYSDRSASAGGKTRAARIERAKSVIRAEAGTAELGVMTRTGLATQVQCDAGDGQECSGGASLDETTPQVVIRLAAAGTDPAAVTSTLAAGGVVAISDMSGTSRATTTRVSSASGESGSPATLVPLLTVTPRERSNLTSTHAAFVSDAGTRRAAAAGLRVADIALDGPVSLLAVDRDLSRSRTDALNAGLAPYQVRLSASSPFQDRVRGVAVLVALLIGLIAVATTVLSVALSIDEQRRDLRVLHAVGAKPSQTRNLYAIQALLVSVLAVVPGAIIGGLAGLAATRYLWQGDLTIPFTPLAMLVTGVPIVATAVGWLWARRVNVHHDHRTWLPT